MLKKIISTSNTTIKHIVKIRKDRKYRNEKKEVLLVGKKIIFDVLKKHPLKLLITTNKDLDIKKYRANDVLLVNDSIMKKITSVSTPEDVAAIISMPKDPILKNQKKILILDKLKDPGNLGTLIRSAYAFDYDIVVLTKDSCDPYLDKAIRSAKSATFFIPILQTTKEFLKDYIQKNKIDSYLADMNGENINKINTKNSFAIILSSESLGIDSFFERFSKKVKIKISNIDSLNVAIAGSIIMEKLR
ncbi:MAG: 23S rRNA (uridine(2479)-2'-O)-methyltransferase [Candidatus Anoxychlamydiales bacterium]|nr:23S rRNA (uridine(2479)-2'-O)-methyltransferase [Candidatus Anoxychlamydiales bacterium]